jgi:PAS domain S-box-containing protein
LLHADYPTFTIAYANKKLLLKLGLDLKDITGKGVVQFAKHLYKNPNTDIILTSLKKVLELKEEIDSGIGLSAINQVKNQPLFDDNGNVQYILRTTSENNIADNSRYKSFFQQAGDAIFISDKEGYILEVNDEACSMFGYTRAELETMHPSQLLVKEDLENKPLRLTELSSTKLVKHRRQAITKNGTIFYIHVSSTALHNGNVLTAVRDINEQVQQEEALAASEAQLQSIVNNEPNCVKVVDKNLNLLQINQAGLEQVEASGLDEVLGKNVLDLVDPDFKRAYKEVYLKALNGEPGKLIFKLKGLKGTVRWLESQAVPFSGFKGVNKTILAITRDISKEKEAHDKLQKSNRRFTSVANATNDAVWEWDMENHTFWGNPGLYKLYGYKNEEGDISSSAFFERVHPEDNKVLKTRMAKAMYQQKPEFTGEYRFKAATHKQYRYFYERVLITYNKKGKPISALGAIQDITPRKKSERLLKKSDEKYRHLFINNPLPMCIYDFDSLRILDCNEAACLKYGYKRSEVLKLTIKALSPSSEVVKLEKMTSFPVEPGDKHTGVFVQCTKNREILFMEITTHIIDHMGKTAALALANDVTEKVKANLKLQTSNQRLKLSNRIGKLAYFELNLREADIRWSAELYRLTKIGRGKKQITWQEFLDIVHPEDLDVIRTFIAQVAKQKNESQLTYRIIWPNQQIRYINAVVKVSKVQHNKVVALEGTMQDITERQEHMDAIKRQNDAFRKIAWTQSHVVRAPLVRIMGICNLILDDSASKKEQEELLKNLVTSSEELDKVLREIVTLTQEVKIN